MVAKQTSYEHPYGQNYYLSWKMVSLGMFLCKNASPTFIEPTLKCKNAIQDCSHLLSSKPLEEEKFTQEKERESEVQDKGTTMISSLEHSIQHAADDFGFEIA